MSHPGQSTPLFDKLHEYVKAHWPHLNLATTYTPSMAEYHFTLGHVVRDTVRLSAESIETGGDAYLVDEVNLAVQAVTDKVWADFGFSDRINEEVARRDALWERQMRIVLMGSGVRYYEADEILKRIKEGL